MRVGRSAEIAAAVATRQAEIVSALQALSIAELHRSSQLPAWSRLTIACHLRYGAEASSAITNDALTATETAFYPLGRQRQRPATLRPRSGERPADVIRSFADTSANLEATWAGLSGEQWETAVAEPANNPDLGTISLGMLAILRLTEVEVHGSDLDIGLGPWSDVFVDVALPMRVRWLPTRRSNSSSIGAAVRGTWILRPSDGAVFAVAATSSGVTVSEDLDSVGDAEIRGSKRDLLAFMLGRLDLSHLAVSGDRGLADSFHLAFPAP